MRTIYERLGEQIEFVSRYGSGQGPDPETMCGGPCEGTGYVPIKGDEEGDPVFKKLWIEAEAEEGHSEDGWQFVVCPDCGGTGLACNVPPDDGVENEEGGFADLEQDAWDEDSQDYEEDSVVCGDYNPPKSVPSLDVNGGCPVFSPECLEGNREELKSFVREEDPVLDSHMDDLEGGDSSLSCRATDCLNGTMCGDGLGEVPGCVNDSSSMPVKRVAGSEEESGNGCISKEEGCGAVLKRAQVVIRDLEED